ncbi:MAG: T9SS type A sorting domain-containing protein [candidate division WOR-3 bacterium]|nr:T9SS type A sorting domain-containing protein [candidate division WOR-3 bacterium]
MRVTPDLDTINSLEICPKFYIQTYPAVTFDGQNYFVVWSDNNFGGSYYYMAAARVTPGGAVLDTGACISSGTGSSEYRAKIAYDGNRCLVVWPKSSGPVYGRFINSQCQPEGSIFTIASAPAGGSNIAFGDTNYLVVWFSGVYPTLELHGQLVSMQGSLVGGPISIVLGSGCHRWADVTFDGTKYLVVWQTGENNVGQKIYGQFIGSDGSLLGDNFMICDNTSQERWWPAVAVSDSNYLITWGQGYSSACDIWGNVDVSITGISEEAGYTAHDTGLNLTVHPNPFHYSTDIRYQITDNSNNASLKVYDAAGQLVKSFYVPSSLIGYQSSVTWDGTDQAGRQVNGGVYFVRLVADDYNATEKVLLIR